MYYNRLIISRWNFSPIVFHRAIDFFAAVLTSDPEALLCFKRAGVVWGPDVATKEKKRPSTPSARAPTIRNTQTQRPTPLW